MPNRLFAGWLQTPTTLCTKQKDAGATKLATTSSWAEPPTCASRCSGLTKCVGHTCFGGYGSTMTPAAQRESGGTAEDATRGRPRDMQRRAAVIAATRELLIANGY